jgi:isopenicillin N synthase-like dioxygenase
MPDPASPFPFPVLDLRDLDSPATALKFRDALREATHTTGFFYLVGTGVTAELETRLLDTVRQFFSLPIEDKLEIENVKR